MFNNFWIVAVVIKLILFGALVYFVQKVKKSVDIADATGIKDNFKIVEIITYIIVLFNYGLFAMKYINNNQSDDKKNESTQKYCGISYINLSLVLILLVFVQQTRSALNVAEKGPVPVSFLSDNFRFTENLTYVILGFNIITHAIIMFFDKNIKIDISSLSFSRRRR